MRGWTSYFLWILPPLIFLCAAFRGIFTPGELLIGTLIMLPFFGWIALVSSCRRNEFLFFPAVVFLSLLQLWPLYLFSPPWVAGALFAAMLVMSVILHGRVWIIVHSVFLWLYGALLIAMLWFFQAFDASFGAPKNPWFEQTIGFIVFALTAVIFVRFTVRNMIDRRRETTPERGDGASDLFHDRHRNFTDGTELHILNGDRALELWKQCGFQGQSLVWRETYLEGPLPDTDDPDVFRNARAEYLSHFAELSGIDKSRLYRHLLKMDEAVLLLPENAALMLWFDSCMFDQTILMRILSLLNRKHAAINVFLYCCDGSCLEKADFMQGYSKKVQLQPQDWAAAGEAWLLFIRKDADGIMRLLERNVFERMPKMKKALLRCIDEIPDRNGLTGTQRNILKLVAGGRHTFMEIFKGLDDFEEYPFLGDTACQRLLDQLVRNGFLIRREDRYELCGSDRIRQCRL